MKWAAGGVFAVNCGLLTVDLRMPELPEVEVICQGLRPHIEGRQITAIWCGPKKLRLPVPRKAMAAQLPGTTISAINRRAKYLLMDLDNGFRLIIHLGMTGRLGIFAAEAPRELHDHICWSLADGMEMRFNDTRRFGFVRLMAPEDEDPLASLGPEPFWPDYNGDYLKEKAGQRLQPIKNFLMDNQVVVGIGNIYANEILFTVGLLPTTPIGSVSRAQWQQLVLASRAVLEKAIKSGGTTISDYVNASGQSGYFQLELMVYGRDGEPCKQCITPIQKQVIAGRASFYCPRCQR